MPARVTRRKVSRYALHPSRWLYILGMKDYSLWKTLFRTFAWASVMFRGSWKGPELVSLFFYLIDTRDLYILWSLLPSAAFKVISKHSRSCWSRTCLAHPMLLFLSIMLDMDAVWEARYTGFQLTEGKVKRVHIWPSAKRGLCSQNFLSTLLCKITCFPHASWFPLKQKTACCWNWNLLLLHSSRNFYEFLRPIHDRLAPHEARLLCIHDCCRSFQELSNGSEKQQLGQRLTTKRHASKEPQLCFVFACDEGCVTRWESSSWHLLKHFLNTCWGFAMPAMHPGTRP